MRKLLTLFICLTSFSAVAQYSGYKAVINTTSFRQEFTRVSQATQSIQCDFTQEKNLSMLSDKITSTGKFWFKRENKVKMEYVKPSYYLLVINGSNITTKDGQKESHISSKSNKTFEQVNKMMIDCVQGTVLDNKNFNTRLFENERTYLVEMSPATKGMQGIFRTITLTVDKKDYSVTRMDMVEQSGDNTVINFLHKQTNVNIPDEVFSVK
jgi:outer membrane lipoprotein-sorting protein